MTFINPAESSSIASIYGNSATENGTGSLADKQGLDTKGTQSLAKGVTDSLLISNIGSKSHIGAGTGQFIALGTLSNTQSDLIKLASSQKNLSSLAAKSFSGGVYDTFFKSYYFFAPEKILVQDFSLEPSTEDGSPVDEVSNSDDDQVDSTDETPSDDEEESSEEGDDETLDIIA